jgi:hypothetical protein
MLKDLMSHKELNELSYMRIFVNEITDRIKYKEFFTKCGQAISTSFKSLIKDICAIGYALMRASLVLIVAVLVCLVLLLMPLWLLCDFISVSYSKYKADMEAD